MFFKNAREKFGVDPMDQMAIDQYAAMPQQRQGGGFGDILKALAGGVLDGVATHYGSQPGYAGAQNARASALAALQARQAELQDYGAKKRIDQQYAKPDEPPAMVRNTQAYAAMSPQERETMRQAYAAMQPAPQDRVIINDGQLVSVPGTMPQGGGMDAPVVEDGFAYTPGPGGKGNQANWKPVGGPAPAGLSPFSVAPPQRLKSGVMTSGRRTREGNRLVGGVDGSWHVDGNAVDYDGPDLNALLGEVRQTFPGSKSFIHKGHVHTQDRRIRAPYFGKRGTTGLRN